MNALRIVNTISIVLVIITWESIGKKINKKTKYVGLFVSFLTISNIAQFFLSNIDLDSVITSLLMSLIVVLLSFFNDLNKEKIKK
ncbi:hypothetical protein [Miniphocaeibacter halophilus]|uniref:Uncharacterized protein n=1 Tax=Miniphocaeibacter halophilus TaxID=2931922 RepID=A0AC61MRW5_9FIRM|nr:hypothetical protein [Miniphocaeibacter halophilus]QQK08334.1 hypothetical protein JFY71_01975 [Miniphocaeibacter halophilus]